MGFCRLYRRSSFDAARFTPMSIAKSTRLPKVSGMDVLYSGDLEPPRRDSIAKPFDEDVGFGLVARAHCDGQDQLGPRSIATNGNN